MLVVERKQSRPTGFKGDFVTEIALRRGGFDTGSTIVSPYSTTDMLCLIIIHMLELNIAATLQLLQEQTDISDADFD